MKIDKIELIKVINEVVEYKLKKLIPVIEKKIRDKLQEEMLLEMSKLEVKPKIDSDKLSQLVESAPSREAKRIVEESDNEYEIPEVQFTHNPVLNKVLNQTLRTPKPAIGPEGSMASLLSEATGYDEQMEDVPTLNFNTGNMPAAPIRMNVQAIPGAEREISPKLPEIPNPNQGLAGVIFRDYRKVLKKAEEKSKEKRMSGVLPLA